MAKRLTKAQLAAAHEEQLTEALRWPSDPCPQPIDVESAVAGREWDDLVRAWTYNAYSGSVTLGCFRSNGHGREGDRTTSQGAGGPWFQTEAQAALACRWSICRKMAEQLLAFDRNNNQA